MAQKLFDSGMRPQDLIFAARSAIQNRDTGMLEKLFKIYGVDPEAKVRLTPYSGKMVSLFDYATAQAPDQNLESVEAHSKVLKTILAAIAAKKENAGVKLAATIATPLAKALVTPSYS